MLIGVLSDIHGNSSALKKVLDTAKKSEVEHLLILGDNVGYYYDAVGVYDLLEGWNKNMIRGNHEDMLISLLDGVAGREEIRRKYGSALELATSTLSKELLEQIRASKRTEDMKVGNCVIRLCHGSPWDTNEYIYPDASIELLNKCDSKGVDYVFLGHTHYPFVFRSQNSCVINPGSVGQSRVRGGVAEWGILNTDNKVYKVMQTPYDTTALKEQVRKVDPNVKYLVEILERNSQ